MEDLLKQVHLLIYTCNNTFLMHMHTYRNNNNKQMRKFENNVKLSFKHVRDILKI